MPKSVSILDGEVKLYRHNNGDYWYFRFKDQTGEKRYIKGSLKTTSYEIASQRAREKYLTYIARITDGFDPEDISWSKAVEQTIATLNYPSAKEILTKLNKRYFNEFFSQYNSVRTFRSEIVGEYFRWRVRYWTNNEPPKTNPPTNIQVVPSVESLVKERRFLRLIFDKMEQKKQIHFIPEYPDQKTLSKLVDGAGKQQAETRFRRPAMSEKSWENLDQYFQTRWDRTKDTKVGKLHTYRLWLWCRFICWTGIRPQELRQIRYSDVGEHIVHINDWDERLAVIVSISKQVSKVKVSRKAISRDEKLMEMIVNWRKYQTEVLGRIIEDNDLIFSQHRFPSDDPKKELWKKQVRMYVGIRNAFKKAGVYSITIDGLETKLSSYSLRGTYITNRVQHGVPKEHIALACGTSATMIERYYSVAQSTDFLESFINLDQNYENPPKITPKIQNAYKRWLNERKSKN